jgi:hypothetical protein
LTILWLLVAAGVDQNTLAVVEREDLEQVLL